MKDNELKPCPFCGTDPTIDHLLGDNNCVERWVITCHGIHCPAFQVTVIEYDEQDAIEAWNRRIK